MRKKEAFLTIRIPAEVKARIEQIATHEDRSVSSVGYRLIMEELNRRQPRISRLMKQEKSA